MNKVKQEKIKNYRIFTYTIDFFNFKNVSPIFQNYEGFVCSSPNFELSSPSHLRIIFTSVFKFRLSFRYFKHIVFICFDRMACIPIYYKWIKLTIYANDKTDYVACVYKITLLRVITITFSLAAGVHKFYILSYI